MKALCVGGPLDGRRITLPHFDLIPSDVDFDLSRFLEDWTGGAKRTMYRTTMVKSDSIERRFLRYKGSLTHMTALDKLLDGYNPEKKDEDAERMDLGNAPGEDIKSTDAANCFDGDSI